MNWSLSAKQIFVYFLVIFSVLIGLSACERSRGIGFDLVPQNEVGVFFTDTLTVDASTVLANGVETTRSAWLLVGQYDDPVFGKISASSFAQFASHFADTLKVGLDQANKVNELLLDSVVLSMPFEYRYANGKNTQTIKIHELQDTLAPLIINTTTLTRVSNTRYFNNSTIKYNPTPLASVLVKIDDLTTTKRLNIHLEKEAGFSSLISQMFQTLKDSIRVQDFVSRFKGFAFIPEDENASVYGFSSASIIFYYRKSENVDNVLTTNTKSFIISSRNWFNNIVSNRSGTILSNLNTPLQEISSKQTGNLSYMQAGVGVQTKLKFPTLLRLKEKGKVVVNKAELVIKPQVASVETYAAPSVLLYQANETNEILTKPLSTGGTTPLLVIADGIQSSQELLFTLNQRNEEYRINVSRHVQQLFSGDITNKDLLLSADYPLDNISYSNRNTVNRLILNNDKASPFRIKLLVYYTFFEGSK